jgi:hypothetical protein
MAGLLDVAGLQGFPPFSSRLHHAESFFLVKPLNVVAFAETHRFAGGGERSPSDDVDDVSHSLLVMQATLTKVRSVSLAALHALLSALHASF